jgi:hypothetical protein
MKTKKLKTSVSSYIYSKFNERGMRSFESKVKKLLRENNIFGNVICHAVFVQRESRGSYLKRLEIEINGYIIRLSEHTHDSQFWDNWENPTSQDKRNLFLAVLESQIDDLKESVNEINNQNDEN